MPTTSKNKKSKQQESKQPGPKKQGAKKPKSSAAAKTASKSPVASSKATKSAQPARGAKRAARKPSRNGFHPGTYTVPRGHVSIAVPPFWSLLQTNDDLQVESEASETEVIVSAYHRNRGIQPLDARDYLRHFLENAPHTGRLQSVSGTRRDAGARFRDAEGDHWFVRFLSNGDTLLLATCHSNRPPNSREARTGVAVLDSIKLKARG
jgi:hypothetical protein